MSIIAFPGRMTKKKLTTEINFVLKKFRDAQDSNVKLENNVSKLKSDLNLSNLSRQQMIIGKSKFDETLGVQLVGNKHEGLGYVPQES